MKLNCDLGEGMDDVDALVIPYIDMASIACGGHAGDDASMLRTVALCLKHCVAIGAHPSYPDRENFGRRSLDIDPDELEASLAAQILRLHQHCRSLGTRLSYIKPHGALYNDAMARRERFDLLLKVVQKNVPGLPLVLLATARNDEYEQHARTAGVQLWFEGFADRCYSDDGSLVSRTVGHAVHSDIDTIARQAVSIARDGMVISENGRRIPIHAHCLCVHSDSPGAIGAIKAIRKTLANTT